MKLRPYVLVTATGLVSTVTSCLFLDALGVGGGPARCAVTVEVCFEADPAEGLRTPPRANEDKEEAEPR
jgi:hypothetical protein